MTVPSQTPLHSALTWHGLDALSGVRTYDVEYSPNGGMSWTPLLTAEAVTQTEFIGTPGESYHFRVRAMDKVNNESDWLVVGPMEISAVTKYYTHNGQRVAMRRGDEVYYLHGDHLGSTSLTTDQSGSVVAETRYLPYGEERWSNGEAVTDFGFTSQRKEGFGLYDYNARYYSPRLGRFISPDTIVPEPASSGGFNRYRYTRNNPLRYTDPSGHCSEELENYEECIGFADQIKSEIDSDTTWDGVNIYDLNWEDEEQVEQFISRHNALPEQLRQAQDQMDFLTNELGPTAEDFWSWWEDISYNEEQIGNAAYAAYREAYGGLIENSPIEEAWKDPATEVVAWTAETLTVELLTEPAELLSRGILITGAAVAEAVNVTAQVVVLNNTRRAKGLYTLSQPQPSRELVDRRLR